MSGYSILTVNGGSSSLKCALFAMHGREVADRHDFSIQDIPESQQDHVAHLTEILGQVREQAQEAPLQAVGHRVVHGGDVFDAPIIVDDTSLADLRSLEPLAPLHQPVNIRLIEACGQELPGVPQIACFDTAFHQHMPAVERTYALPQPLCDAGVCSYGFHGLSYEYIQSCLEQRDARTGDKRIIIAHLGAGASLCAMQSGQCVATTMGFSTAEGLPMMTRSGSIDPGIMIYLMREHGMNADDLEQLIYRDSGLQALAGICGGMRELEAAPDPAARAAIDYFVYRVAGEIGRLVAALGGLDGLVFTGGVGANSVQIRRRVGAACQWLGVTIDNAANESGHEVISDAHGEVEVWVVPTDEEAQILHHVLQLTTTNE